MSIETKVKRDGTRFNPRMGNGFTNEKFGEGSIIINIDKEGLKAVMDNLREGSAILLKYNKVTSQGNKHYFAEILPPMNRQTGERNTPNSVKTGSVKSIL